jgi:hypothetical protein
LRALRKSDFIENECKGMIDVCTNFNSLFKLETPEQTACSNDVNQSMYKLNVLRTILINATTLGLTSAAIAPAFGASSSQTISSSVLTGMITQCAGVPSTMGAGLILQYDSTDRVATLFHTPAFEASAITGAAINGKTFNLNGYVAATSGSSACDTAGAQIVISGPCGAVTSANPVTYKSNQKTIATFTSGSVNCVT